MILHFLGLDHIGHKAGPKSPNMLPKQREMDGIVESIYSAIIDPELPHLHRTLLVLLGDHGMNDGGNHGGSSEGETSPVLTFISPLLEMVSDGGTECPTQHQKGDCCGYYETIEQSDVVPTLAGLLGVPIPRNNLGVFIDGVLGFWDDGEYGSLFVFSRKGMERAFGMADLDNRGAASAAVAECPTNAQCR